MAHACPSISELLGGDVGAQEHANRCDRCRALLALAAKVPAPEAGETPHFEPATLPEREPLAERTLGEIVALVIEDSPELLLAAVLAVGEEALQVAPLSTETSAAAEWDLVLAPEDGPLGYATIAEVWNHGRVDTSQLSESYGALTNDASKALLALYASLRHGETPEDLQTGPALLAERDPRMLFQEAEGERARRYWSNAEEPEVEHREGIGARLFVWIEEAGADPADLATDLGWRRSEIDAVLEEKIEPLSESHSPEGLSDLFKLTDIDAEEVKEMLPDSVIWQSFPAEESQSHEFALRRAPAGVEQKLLRGARRSGGEHDEPTLAQRRALETYVSEVVTLLEEKRG
jgi:hypothetical protein